MSCSVFKQGQQQVSGGDLGTTSPSVNMNLAVLRASEILLRVWYKQERTHPTYHPHGRGLKGCSAKEARSAEMG